MTEINSPNTHRITTSTVTHIHQHPQPEKRYRNCHIAHSPDLPDSALQTGFYQLSNARISKCKKFFEEDFSSVENPEKKLGVAKFELSKNNKLNLSNSEATQKLIRSLFSAEKHSPTILVFD